MGIELTSDKQTDKTKNKTKQYLKEQKIKTVLLPGSKLDLWISFAFVFQKPVLANSLQSIFTRIYRLFRR